jgi:hypothetical protein
MLANDASPTRVATGVTIRGISAKRVPDDAATECGAATSSMGKHTALTRTRSIVSCSVDHASATATAFVYLLVATSVANTPSSDHAKFNMPSGRSGPGPDGGPGTPSVAIIGRDEYTGTESDGGTDATEVAATEHDGGTDTTESDGGSNATVVAATEHDGGSAASKSDGGSDATVVAAPEHDDCTDATESDGGPDATEVAATEHDGETNCCGGCGGSPGGC